MSSRHDHDLFAPPPRSKYLRAWLMALAAHILLLVAYFCGACFRRRDFGYG